MRYMPPVCLQEEHDAQNKAKYSYARFTLLFHNVIEQ